MIRTRRKRPVTEDEAQPCSSTTNEKKPKEEEPDEELYQCSICPGEGDVMPRDLWINHLESAHKLFPCKVCNTVLGTKWLLNQHHVTKGCVPARLPVMEIPDESKLTLTTPPAVQECEECGLILPTQSWVKHLETKHATHPCRFCFKKFKQKYQLRQHLMECERVKEVNERVKERNTQVKDSEQGLLKSFYRQCQCPVCKVWFHTLFELNQHKTEHTAYADYDFFECTGCKLRFKTSNGLRTHLQTANRESQTFCVEGRVRLQPPKTGKKKNMPMNGSRSLTVSEFQKAEGPEEEHDEQTQRALVAAYMLSDRGSVSSSANYYPALKKMLHRVDCPFCHLLCKSYAALHTHISETHDQTQRALYQCTGCQTTFSTPTGLGQHLRREYDYDNWTCFDQATVIIRSEYKGEVTSWRKKNDKWRDPAFLAGIATKIMEDPAGSSKYFNMAPIFARNILARECGIDLNPLTHLPLDAVIKPRDLKILPLESENCGVTLAQTKWSEPEFLATIIARMSQSDDAKRHYLKMAPLGAKKYLAHKCGVALHPVTLALMEPIIHTGTAVVKKEEDEDIKMDPLTMLQQPLPKRPTDSGPTATAEIKEEVDMGYEDENPVVD